MATNVSCQQCGSEMKKTKKTDRDLGLQVIGVILFLIGLCLLFAFPFGTLIGIVFMIVAGRMGHKRTKVMKCRDCGYFFQIA